MEITGRAILARQELAKEECNKAMSGVKETIKPDDRTPNQKRLDELIEINDDILEEMKTMNKNLAIVGAALIKMVEGKKKAVDKAK